MLILGATLFFALFATYAVGQELKRKADKLGRPPFWRRFGRALKASAKWWVGWCVGILVWHSYKKDHSETIATLIVALSIYLISALVSAVELPKKNDPT